MGKVYLARQTLLKRLVAVKSLKGLGNGEVPLQEEAQTMADLNHPNIVICHDIIQNNDQLFLVMEYIPGRMSLRDLVERFGPLPENVAAQVLLDIVTGMEYLYSKGYTHRDMKPDNVLVHSDLPLQGKSIQDIFRHVGTRIKISDFGIARHLLEGADGQNPTLRAKGSPNYMAPEQALSPQNTDFRSDIYAICGTMYFALTGRPPFAFDKRDELLKYKAGHAIPNPCSKGADISPFFSSVLAKMGRVSPEDRYQSYGDLKYDAQTLYSSSHKKLFREWKLVAAWRGACLLLLALLLGMGTWLGVRTYLVKTYRSSLQSFASSMVFWNGRPLSWTVDPGTDDAPAVLRNLLPGAPLQLKPTLRPGQTLEFQVKHPTTGMVQMSLEKEGQAVARLKWSRVTMGSTVFHFGNDKNSYAIEDIAPGANDWVRFSFTLLANGVTLHINGEQVAILRVKGLPVCTLQLCAFKKNTGLFRNIILYDTQR